MGSPAPGRLRKEFKDLSRQRNFRVELVGGNLLRWNVVLIVSNRDSIYYGGYWPAELEFDKNFPIIPPQIKFNPPVFHPNIYRDGRVCISILHSPGDEEVSGEMPSERWTPIQSVQSILWSVLVLLDQANCDSPANVEAGVMFRTRMASYRARVQAEVTASVERKPWGIVLATAEDEGRGTETTCLEDEEVFIDQSGDIVMLDVP